MLDRVATISPASVLEGASPLVLTAMLEPVAGLDRFQPAGFPEIGHVIYTAPRADGSAEHVCIVDSAASMANHLESICMRSAHDLVLVDDLIGMPHLRCVTGNQEGDAKLKDAEVVVTSLTEGHRIASTYFLAGKRVDEGGSISLIEFRDELADEMGVVLKKSKSVAHPPPDKWWNVFATIFRYDPNALLHGVLFPQWQIKISRLLTAHLEAFGADRIERSGVKFDRLGKTTSGQPIFAVDDETAREIRATFILDVALLRSFGRVDGEKTKGLDQKQKEFLTALALWKIRRLLEQPFRFRSACYLQLKKDGLKSSDTPIEIDVDIESAIKTAGFLRDGEKSPVVTDIYWPREMLYQEKPEKAKGAQGANEVEAEIDEDGEESSDEDR